VETTSVQPDAVITMTADAVEPTATGTPHSSGSELLVEAEHALDPAATTNKSHRTDLQRDDRGIRPNANPWFDT